MNKNKIPPGSCTPDEHRFHRRLFLKGAAAAGCASVTSFSGLFTNPVFAEASRKAEKKVILLWLCGAPSQFETWDPKPDAGSEIRGEFGPIKTNVPGVLFSEPMAEQAKVADKMVILRAIHHPSTQHSSSVHLNKTGYYCAPPAETAKDRKG